jgi:hypothetical protein
MTYNSDMMLNELRLIAGLPVRMVGEKTLSRVQSNICAYGIITVHENMHIREDSTQTATGKQNTASHDQKHRRQGHICEINFNLLLPHQLT